MLRGSEQSQERVRLIIGSATLLCAVLIIVVFAVKPFGGQPPDRIRVAIDTPYIGQGIQTGTAVVLHGVEVGKVTDVTLSPSGGLRLSTELRQQPLTGLTDAMNIDFRPINYFGVPGVNIIPTPGGQAVRNGTEINLVPKGNFTLSQLLSELAHASAAALTPQLITVIDRVARYTDGFNPLFETLVNATTAVADVQKVTTANLLAKTAIISTTLPPFMNEMIIMLARFADFQYYPYPGDPSGRFPETPPPISPAASPKKLFPPYLEYTFVRNSSEESDDYMNNVEDRFLELASGGLFAAVGRVLRSHSDDLLPLIQGIKAVSDPMPSLLRPGDIAQTLAELRSRFEKLYGGNGEQRALQVRILLDSLPGVAAPLGIVTGGRR